MKLPIADLLIDQSIQVRTELDQDALAEYAEMLDVSEPPPVVVFDDANILADGFHRVEAARLRGRLDIEVERKAGGREDAEAYAVVANTKGRALRLTREERNRGIRRLLDLGWSQRRIGDEMGVGSVTVLNIEHERKARANLPTDLAGSEALTPTHLYRIATLPPDSQEPVARVVHELGLSEPDTRTLIRDIRAEPVPVAGLSRDEVMRHVKGEVKRIEEADPWLALVRVTQAMGHLREFDIDEVLAAVPTDEASVFAMQLDDLLDYIGRIRERLGKTPRIRTVS